MTGRRSYAYLLAIVALSVFLFQTGRSASIKTKRSIGQFGNMIRHTTQMEALLFNNYGNHCGSGDTGNEPVLDAIDQCCRVHDLCYEDLSRNPCSSYIFGPYLIRYTWRVNGTSLAIECGDTIDTIDACKLATCNCDRAAAQCFARHAGSYNNTYKRKSFWDFLI